MIDGRNLGANGWVISAVMSEMRQIRAAMLVASSTRSPHSSRTSSACADVQSTLHARVTHSKRPQPSLRSMNSRRWLPPAIHCSLLWLRALRVLIALPGPLVLMVVKMTRDVTKWALLLLMISPLSSPPFIPLS